MYEKIIIGSLLLGCISISSVSPTTPNGATTQVTTTQKSLYPREFKPTATEHLVTITPLTETSATRKKTNDGWKKGGRISHVFSEPVIITIVLAVIAGIVGFILLVVYFIRLLTKKSSLDMQPTFSNDADDSLTSVEAGNPESNQ
ncbi:PREDICTED: glycophorin-A [Hipposideros armiger]|uniref:Glycophorin-A n=1 Tax=Hipposideros armiger TaxID=186990 RepID=A0A8B7SXQ8_HIPAR|nr:PREDICTED: glycophorin-A [Hipposideros armiger]